MPPEQRSNLRTNVRRLSAGAFALGLTVYPLAAAVAAAAYIAVAPARRRYSGAFALALVGLLGGASAALAPRPLASALAWLGWLTVGAVFVLVAQRWSAEDGRSATMGFAGGLVATLGLELYQRTAGGSTRPEGFTVHPNLEAGLVVTVIGAVATGWALAAGQGRRGAWPLALVMGAGLLALVMTGSRGAMLGLVLGVAAWLALYLIRFSWRRLLPWLLGAVAVMVLGVGAALALAGGGTRNLLRNSGFEHGGLPWSLQAASAVVEAGAGAGTASGNAVRLTKDAPQRQALVAYTAPLRVRAGERLTLSYSAKPAGAGAAGASIDLQLRTAAGRFLARAGGNGWAGPGGGGGPAITLPSGPPGVWQRVSVPLPPLPKGAATLTLAVIGPAATTGSYGEVDAFQLERGARATPYTAGDRPGLGVFLAPVTSRVASFLRDPEGASVDRLGMWWAGLQLAALRPILGYGPGSEVRVVRRYALDYYPRPLDHFHDFYLKMLIEGGSVTLAAFLAWLGLTAWSLLRRYSQGSVAAAVALATLLAVLVHSVFEPVLAHPYVSGSLWLVVCSAMYGGEENGAGVENSVDGREVV